jgi:sugar-specific transcriptional regulator TrmB
MKKELLKELGLSRNEIKVYLTLLRLGSAPAGKITKEVDIHRRNVYDSIDRLAKKGLVGFVVKDKIKHFEAVNPYRFMDMIHEEKEKIERKEKNISSMLADLLAIKNVSKTEKSVVVLTGAKGIKNVLEDVLRTRQENLVLGAHKPPAPIKNYLEGFHRKRVKAGVKERLIFNRSDSERAGKLARMPRTKVRYLLKDYDGSVSVNIYGDKVAILMWSDPMAILIENKEIAKSFKEYFNVLWKATKS